MFAERKVVLELCIHVHIVSELEVYTGPTVIYICSSCGIEFVKSVKAFRCTLSNSNWRNLSSFTGQPILPMKLFRGRTIFFSLNLPTYVGAQGAQNFSLRSDGITGTSYFLLIGDI